MKTKLELVELEGTRALILCRVCHRKFVHHFHKVPADVREIRALMIFGKRRVTCTNPDCGSRRQRAK